MAKCHRTAGDRAEKVSELHQQLAAEIDTLVASEGWTAMLEAGARFHRYSPNNVLLILRQCPDATRVAGYRTWQSMGRQVRKGERGIAVLAPCRYKVTDESGDESFRLGGFKVSHVFDLAQTDGEPIADVRPTLLEGEAPDGLLQSLREQVWSAGFETEITSRDEIRGANGMTDWGRRVVSLASGLSEAQAAKTMAHELAHVLLHEGESFTCRGVKEVEAESVAYIVATANGMSTEGYSLPYVAHWANGDAKVVANTAQRVMATARHILEKIDAETADQSEKAGVAA